MNVSGTLDLYIFHRGVRGGLGSTFLWNIVEMVILLQSSTDNVGCENFYGENRELSPDTKLLI